MNRVPFSFFFFFFYSVPSRFHKRDHSFSIRSIPFDWRWRSVSPKCCPKKNHNHRLIGPRRRDPYRTNGFESATLIGRRRNRWRHRKPLPLNPVTNDVIAVRHVSDSFWRSLFLLFYFFFLIQLADGKCWRHRLVNDAKVGGDQENGAHLPGPACHWLTSGRQNALHLFSSLFLYLRSLFFCFVFLLRVGENLIVHLKRSESYRRGQWNHNGRKPSKTR